MNKPLNEQLINDVKKHLMLRDKVKIVYLPENKIITWIESNAVEVNNI